MSEHEHRTCPKCGGQESSRIKRVGVLQKFILPPLGLFPWECSDCRRVFFLRARGTAKKHRSSAEALDSQRYVRPAPPTDAPNGS